MPLPNTPLQLANLTAKDVDINHGVDFERARETLARAAGDAYAHYTAQKALDERSDTTEAAWESYVQASADLDGLRRTDSQAIKAVLQATHQ